MDLSKVSIIKVFKAFLPLINFLELTLKGWKQFESKNLSFFLSFLRTQYSACPSSGLGNNCLHTLHVLGATGDQGLEVIANTDFPLSSLLQPLWPVPDSLHLPVWGLFFFQVHLIIDFDTNCSNLNCSSSWPCVTPRSKSGRCH